MNTSAKARLILKTGKIESLRRFHPWVFSGAIKRIEGEPKEGDLVELYDNHDHFLALGHYGESSIAARVISFENEEINSDFFKSKFTNALRYRLGLNLLRNDNNVFRLVHGEADGLPGLIVDFYNGVAVMEFHSAGMENISSLLATALKEAGGDLIKAIVSKSKNIRENNANLLFGDEPSLPHEICENENKFLINWQDGQKTGFFIDQRENRQKVKNYSGGAGLYAKSSGNNFASRMLGNSFPGAFIQTNSSSAMALQVASGSASYTNPAALLVGSTQFDCSNANAHSVLINNLSGEPTVAPSIGGWGYLGTNSVSWYYLYYQNAIAVSRRELKRDIQPLNKDLYNYALNEIMKMKPSLYKFNNENDELVSGSESKTRYNYHLGLILDETPDFIQDNAFSGIDVYSLSTLNLAGIQAVNSQLQEIPVTDFGQGRVTANETRINYSDILSKADVKDIPIVNITPTSPNAKFYIKSQDKNGFVIVSENGPMTFNWTANAHKNISEKQYDIPASVMSQLKVDESKKATMRSITPSKQTEPLQLLGPIEGKASNKRK